MDFNTSSAINYVLVTVKSLQTFIVCENSNSLPQQASKEWNAEFFYNL